MNLNNWNSNWKEILGFGKMQEKLEKYFLFPKVTIIIEKDDKWKQKIVRKKEALFNFELLLNRSIFFCQNTALERLFFLRRLYQILLSLFHWISLLVVSNFYQTRRFVQ